VNVLIALVAMELLLDVTVELEVLLPAFVGSKMLLAFRTLEATALPTVSPLQVHTCFVFV